MPNSEAPENTAQHITPEQVPTKNVVQIFKPATATQAIESRDTMRVSWDWHETWQEEHQKAFTVAKMTKADLLNEVHQSLCRAVDEGWSFAQWKKYIVPKLEGKWLGKTKGQLWDEMSEEEKAKHREPDENEREQVITEGRLATIFRTNMRVSYAAGNYKHHMSIVSKRPYWKYSTVHDTHVRAIHAVLDGKIFRYDDPIWETHYPPNGWGCRCMVSTLSERDMNKEKDGKKPELSDSRSHREEYTDEDGRQHVGYNYGNKTVYPDDGWGYNPADSPALQEVAKEKAKTYPEPLRKQAEQDLNKGLAPQAETAKPTAAASTKPPAEVAPAEPLAAEPPAATAPEVKTSTAAPAQAGAGPKVSAPAKVKKATATAKPLAVESPAATAPEVKTSTAAPAQAGAGPKVSVPAKVKKAKVTAKPLAEGKALKPVLSQAEDRAKDKKQAKELDTLAKLMVTIKGNIVKYTAELDSLMAIATANEARLRELDNDKGQITSFVTRFEEKAKIVTNNIEKFPLLLDQVEQLYKRLKNSTNTIEFAVAPNGASECVSANSYLEIETEDSLDAARRVTIEQRKQAIIEILKTEHKIDFSKLEEQNNALNSKLIIKDIVTLSDMSEEAAKYLYTHIMTGGKLTPSTGAISGAHNFVSFVNKLAEWEKLDYDSIRIAKINGTPGFLQFYYNDRYNDENDAQVKTLFSPNYAKDFFRYGIGAFNRRDENYDVIERSEYRTSIGTNTLEKIESIRWHCHTNGILWQGYYDHQGNVIAMYPKLVDKRRGQK